MIDYTVIGKRIQLKRQNKGITQEKLAEKVGISVVYLSKLKMDGFIPLLRPFPTSARNWIPSFPRFYLTPRLPAKTMQTTACWNCSTPVPSGSNPSRSPCWKSFPNYKLQKSRPDALRAAFCKFYLRQTPPPQPASPRPQRHRRPMSGR